MCVLPQQRLLMARLLFALMKTTLSLKKIIWLSLTGWQPPHPGPATITPDSNIQIDQQPARAFLFDPGVELSTIVEAVNAVGTSPADLVAILEALREAGSLRAELVVI